MTNETAHNVRAEFDSSRGPVGTITRGTTNPNRLRRADRWMFFNPTIRDVLDDADHPLAIDVGYGASNTTTCGWARWLHRIRCDIDVVGLEIHPDRVLPPVGRVRFMLGGFELAGMHPHLVRAFNVLRQYDVSQVEDAWATVCARLAPGGVFIEGTCDEIGRHCTWVSLNGSGPQTLTIAFKPGSLHTPSDIAARLPKVLIHRNTPGNRIYDVLRLLDRAWEIASPLSVYGPRARWFHALRLLTTITDGQLSFRCPTRPVCDCVVTFDWADVAP